MIPFDTLMIAAEDEGGSIWNNSVIVNTLILAVIGLITELLRRRFSKKDTAYDRIVRQLNAHELKIAWQGKCLGILDEDDWTIRRIAGAAGIVLPPRPDMPPPPQIVVDGDRSSTS